MSLFVHIKFTFALFDMILIGSVKSSVVPPHSIYPAKTLAKTMRLRKKSALLVDNSPEKIRYGPHLLLWIAFYVVTRTGS